MFFRKVIYLVCYSWIFYSFLFLSLPFSSFLFLSLPFSSFLFLSLPFSSFCPVASPCLSALYPPHSAAVRSFSLVPSSLLFCFVSVPVSVLAFSSFFPFALLLLSVSLRFTPSLCRCLCLLPGFQLLAVLFCFFPVVFALFCLLLPLFPLFASFLFLQTPHN